MPFKSELKTVQLFERQKAIVMMVEDGLSVKDIAELFDISETYVYELYKGYKGREISEKESKNG